MMPKIVSKPHNPREL